MDTLDWSQEVSQTIAGTLYCDGKVKNMKIPITKSDKERILANVIITIMITGTLLLGYCWRDEEYITETILEYFFRHWGAILGLMLGLGVFWYLAISTLTEYDVREDGLYVMPCFRDHYFKPWTEFMYVGPIGYHTGQAGPGKVFLCAERLPYKDKRGFIVLPKEKIIIEYTPEAKGALEQYCPVYSTRFEEWRVI